MRQLGERGRTNVRAVMIGAGPELDRVRAEAAGLESVVFTGAVAHDRMPACLAAADIGVAPFDVTAHKPLQIGFYWSPLKVFEYMAAGLPVVIPDIDRLRHIVRQDREGVTYDPSTADGLANAIETLLDSERRTALGRAARERVETEFSWAAHCRKLDHAMRQTVQGRHA
jgi:glycosyltransferase involved in cell wall biosynthesis